MKILCYQMFFHKKMMNSLDTSMHKYVFCSSERRMDQSGMINSFYENSIGAQVREETMNSIILRCRYLSGINNKSAREYVRRMWRSVEELFDKEKFDLVLTCAVDNYVLDIIYHVASQRKILALQPRKSPLPGLTRITNSCDHPKLREVEYSEASAVLDLLNDGFKAQYQKNTQKDNLKPLKRAVRELCKKPIFELWKKIYRDPLSFHYNTIFPNKNAITVSSLAQIGANRYFNKLIDDLGEVIPNYDKVIFWPLSMSPESAINYLNKDYRLSDYKYLMEIIVAALPDNWCLIIKEHPSAIGYRPVDHYTSLLSKDNVLRASMALSTSQIISLSDAVLLTTAGTTGLEAVALGKNVLSIGSCHYKFGSNIKEINSISNVGNWSTEIEFLEIEKSRKIEIIRNYLTNTVDKATWGPRPSINYKERIRRTAETCISLANSGYFVEYFDN